MKWLQLFEGFKNKKRGKFHHLSGIALIVDEKILLVHPKKFKKDTDKWSIPKGHVEGKNSLNSALKELEEETGIKLNKNYDDVLEITYKKSGALKYMDVYLYFLNKNDISKYIKNWEIKKKFFDKKEIWRSKFFSYAKARKKIELVMIDIIDYLEENY